MKQVLVFTDLDGSLLDHHDYAWYAAEAALSQLLDAHIPVIYNTSKTLPECLRLQQEMSLGEQALIVENGASVYIPGWQQVDDSLLNNAYLERSSDHTMVHLGSTYEHLVKQIERWRSQFGFDLQGFHQMSADQVAELTGLNNDQAELAMQRVASLPFVWHDSEEALVQLQQLANNEGLKLLKGGRFYHLIGRTDKGRALCWYRDWYQKHIQQEVVTFAFGDSQNDLAMLEAADFPTLIPAADGSLLELQHPALFRADVSGPAGWQQGFEHHLNAGNLRLPTS